MMIPTLFGIALPSMPHSIREMLSGIQRACYHRQEKSSHKSEEISSEASLKSDGEIGLRILEMSEPKFTAASEEEEQMSSFALRPSDDGARVSLTGLGVRRFLGDGIILWRETSRRQGVPEKAPPQKTRFVPCMY